MRVFPIPNPEIFHYFVIKYVHGNPAIEKHHQIMSKMTFIVLIFILFATVGSYITGLEDPPNGSYFSFDFK